MSHKQVIAGERAAAIRHVLFACDSFKGTLPSFRAGEAAERGIRHALALRRMSGGDGPHSASQPEVTGFPSSPQPPAALQRASSSSSHLTSLANELATAEIHYVHCPMSDGGAGLLDSVTYRSSHRTKQAAAAAAVASPLPLQFTSTREEKEKVGAEDENMVSLTRAYVPFAVTGPLGHPIGCSSDTHDRAASKSQDGGGGGDDDGGGGATSAPVSFAYDIRHNIVVVEMAESSGLPRVPSPLQRNPLHTTTYGTGEVIRYALRYTAHAIAAAATSSSSSPKENMDSSAGGAMPLSFSHVDTSSLCIEKNKMKEQRQQMQMHRHRYGLKLYLGVGGSATNDGGLGALQALGLHIYVTSENEKGYNGGGQDGNEAHVEGQPAQPACKQSLSKEEEEEEVLLTRPFCGRDLPRVTRVELSTDLLRRFPASKSSIGPSSSPSQVMAHRLQGGEGEGEGAQEQTGDDDAEDAAVDYYVEELYLICDVDNPLVGPHGATYIYGPQKCAPPTMTTPATFKDGKHPAKTTATDATMVIDEGAVGVVYSDSQRDILDRLERGMWHAATRVVASTWRLKQDTVNGSGILLGDSSSRTNTTCVSDPAGQEEGIRREAVSSACGYPHEGGENTSQEKSRDSASVVECATQQLLHGPGGGGAGGMSGFFKYILNASWLPGADAVAELLGLFTTSTLLSVTKPAVPNVLMKQKEVAASNQKQKQIESESSETPWGLLCTHCDVLVTGEGSFDTQTVHYRKTVGRLLEMCVEANVERLLAHYANKTAVDSSCFSSSHVAAGILPCSLIRDVVVICGRSGFNKTNGSNGNDDADADYDDDAEASSSCQAEVTEALCRTLVRSSGSDADDPLRQKQKPLLPHRIESRLRLLACHMQEQMRCSERSSRDALGSATAVSHVDSEAISQEEQQLLVLRDVLLHSGALPHVHVLPLVPDMFPVAEAMTNTYACIERRVALALSKDHS